MIKDYWGHADNWGKTALICALIFVFLGISILIIFFIIICVHFNADITIPPDMQHSGEIGDYIGGVVGTLFAIVGTFLLFSTLVVQSTQMKLQKEELSKTQESIRFQNFENSLFAMIHVQREIQVNLNIVYINL